ncbi:MAG: 4'-phosphopantetheinyl transferase [Sulfitobacter sp.]
MGAPDRLARAQAVIAALFDNAVAVAVTDPRAAQPEALGGEADHLSRAFPTRKQEFAAGRAAARSAMARLGHAPQPIHAAKDRAPIWPEGIAGSISHKATLCAAAVTDAPVLFGLDIEENTDLAADLMSAICSDAELDRIKGPHQARLAKLIFSAKEAAYKAQYPETGMLFGFDHMDVTLDLAAQTFTATFVQPAGCFAVGDTLPGRFDEAADHLVTAVMAPHGAHKGA